MPQTIKAEDYCEHDLDNELLLWEPDTGRVLSIAISDLLVIGHWDFNSGLRAGCWSCYTSFAQNK
jgi:hypothetical protein